MLFALVIARVLSMSFLLLSLFASTFLGSEVPVCLDFSFESSLARNWKPMNFSCCCFLGFVFCFVCRVSKSGNLGPSPCVDSGERVCLWMSRYTSFRGPGQNELENVTSRGIPLDALQKRLLSSSSFFFTFVFFLLKGAFFVCMTVRIVFVPICYELSK